MDAAILGQVGFWGHWALPVALLVFGLGMVVFVHELGHFLVAKLVGIKVERFALGFGKRLFGFKFGETDYCIKLLPLGGYIKMLGQEDLGPVEDGQTDPRAFCNKSIAARFGVISAGVIMNVIFAALLFVIIYMSGVRYLAPVVGAVVPGWPADQAKVHWPDEFPRTPALTVGIQPGDTILSIDGEETTRFQQIRMTAINSRKDSTYEFAIEREVKGRKYVGKTTLGLKPMLSPSGSGETIPAFGIGRASDTVFDESRYFKLPGVFKDGDRIVAVNGRQVRRYWEIAEIEETLAGRAAVVTVERDGERRDITIQPDLLMRDWYCLKDGTVLRGKAVAEEKKENVFKVHLLDGGAREVDGSEDLLIVTLDILGLHPRLKAHRVELDSPADEAGMLPGDVIVGYADWGAPSRHRLHELNEEFAGRKTQIVVLRNGRRLPLRIGPGRKRRKIMIGIIVGVDMAHLAVAGIRLGSPAAGEGIRNGDRITKVNGKAVTTWSDLFGELKTLRDKEVTITYERGPGDERTWRIDKLTAEMFRAADYGSSLLDGRRPLKPLKGPEMKEGPLGAVALGATDTWNWLVNAYVQFRSLLLGTVSPKEAAGPLGIGSIAIEHGRKGLIEFLLFLAMISVLLAVINFLPLPVVDGGHAVFLLIEKIRGRPLSMKATGIIQTIGIALLLFVFLYVTWQDIGRLLRNMWL